MTLTKKAAHALFAGALIVSLSFVISCTRRTGQEPTTDTAPSESTSTGTGTSSGATSAPGAGSMTPTPTPTR